MQTNKNFIKLCNLESQNEINKRILERNTSIFVSNNQLSCRPTATKYTLPTLSTESTNDCCYLPRVETKGKTSVSYQDYASNVEDESILRNQIFALQNCPKRAYIPSSTSNMYVNNVSISSTNNNNSELLFPNLVNTNLVEEEDNDYNKFRKHQVLYFNNQTTPRGN